MLILYQTDKTTLCRYRGSSCNSQWVKSIDSVPDNEFDELMKRTIKSGHSIRTMHLALRDLKNANPDFLKKLEEKINVDSYMRMITKSSRHNNLTN